jgi:hypothetical protein
MTRRITCAGDNRGNLIVSEAASTARPVASEHWRDSGAVGARWPVRLVGRRGRPVATSLVFLLRRTVFAA